MFGGTTALLITLINDNDGNTSTLLSFGLCVLRGREEEGREGETKATDRVGVTVHEGREVMGTDGAEEEEEKKMEKGQHGADGRKGAGRRWARVGRG